MGGLHELTSSGANADEMASTRLPAPKSFLLTRHNWTSLAILIEHHVKFTKRSTTKPTILIKRLQDRYLTAYMDDEELVLPRVGALMTMPIMLPDGQLLSANGLNRDLKTVFRIEPSIIELMPHGNISETDVRDAMTFLTEEWLTDVQCSYDSQMCVDRARTQHHRARSLWRAPSISCYRRKARHRQDNGTLNDFAGSNRCTGCRIGIRA